MANYASILLIAGGIYHLFFAFFHIFFWRVNFLNWQEELPHMSPINRSVIQMLNIAVIVFMFLIAYISLEYYSELLTPGLGRALLLGTSFFWLTRLIGEFTLKDGTPAKPVLVFAFAIGILLYLLSAVAI
jgi:heme/copper-type cytochrome/quinol oxidase subunit 2